MTGQDIRVRCTRCMGGLQGGSLVTGSFPRVRLPWPLARVRHMADLNDRPALTNTDTFSETGATERHCHCSQTPPARLPPPRSPQCCVASCRQPHYGLEAPYAYSALPAAKYGRCNAKQSDSSLKAQSKSRSMLSKTGSRKRLLKGGR